jgi:hypothetical protein
MLLTYPAIAFINNVFFEENVEGWLTLVVCICIAEHRMFS